MDITTEREPKLQGGVIQIRNWQVFLTLVLWLVSMAMAWTSLRDDADESKRRIHELEQRPVVTEKQLEDWERSVTQRLDRIENKLDNAEIRPKR
jgi:hypothetical protein